eukprot:1158288-Pelagomonas_calceolata.AAC.8
MEKKVLTPSLWFGLQAPFASAKLPLCTQAVAGHHHTQNTSLTPKIQCWTDIIYTDGSVMKTKDDSLVGSGIYEPNKEGDHSSPQLQLYIKPNGHGSTNTINRSKLAGILVELQQGHTDITTDSAYCLSQIYRQILNPMRMRTHLHAEFIHATSTIVEQSPRQTNSLKVKTHSDVIGNEGADACAQAAALMDTTYISLPDAKDPLNNPFWLSRKDRPSNPPEGTPIYDS